MAHRYGDRLQMSLLPKCIEDYVKQDAPVRAYDAFVEALDFKELGIDIDPSRVGNSQYDPKAMLKLLVYGYSYGVKSSRKLEREIHNNLTFIWLMGGLKPDHKTIAEFRRKNKKSLKKVLKQCARICIKLNLIDGNVLFVDGTKIRANACRSNTHDAAWYEKHIDVLDKKIELLLTECEKKDKQEQSLGSFVSMDKKLAKTANLKNKMQIALEELKQNDRKKVNLTDPDCAIIHSIQGSHASYNVQSVVDDKNGLIVHVDTVNDPNDLNQFANQIDQANESLPDPCEVACADAGYADTDELEKIDELGIKVIVPSHRQALRNGEDPFSKSEFTYNKEKDCYYCPQGHILPLKSTEKKKGRKCYVITDREHCHCCKNYGKCTTSKSGRKVTRIHNEELKEKLEAQYEEDASRKVYDRRKNRVELPFGHIKRNLKTDAFLLRGRNGVQAETSLLATCFNMARMITIYGVSSLIEQFRDREIILAT